MDAHDYIPPPEFDVGSLRAAKVLGRGATGIVFLARDTSSPHHPPFALKVVDESVAHPHAARRARHEISVLRRLSSGADGGAGHPFLPLLLGSSEGGGLICWATPFCPGGDLNDLRHRQHDRAFSPAVIRFYLAEIVCALEHLHRRGIVYRDLKPENVLVQRSGHVTLTDFDLSRDLHVPTPKPEIPVDENPVRRPPATRNFTRLIFPGRGNHAQQNKNKKGTKKPKSARVSPVSRRPNPGDLPTNERSNSFVGTVEYVAPEVIRGDGYEFAVDWWALGVLCYEMLYGATPFKGRNRKETFQKILLAEPAFMGKPDALTDLIKGLLEKDPTRRLGYGRGACEVKEHEFFRGLRWDLLMEVSRPPFLPSAGDEADTAEWGTDVTEYFQKLRQPPSPSRSPSIDECRNNFSLTEF
ncbi:Serine/threonine-protein kinase UCNL [Striga hermonthica]|uniref:non-specific serine/threonine protein kinase n=1 Tax=Striga hermonthica TaxID=68872 RepID=A0A9N7NQH3_STRHE|nr:Serine/threonine-protein kinase UCNL [Striga hermonthica]